MWVFSLCIEAGHCNAGHQCIVMEEKGSASCTIYTATAAAEQRKADSALRTDFASSVFVFAVYLYLYCSVALQCTCSVAVQLHHQLSRWGIVVDCRLLQCSCSVVLWLCSASCSWAGGGALVHCRGLEINQPPTPGRERTTLQTQRPASPPSRLFFRTLQN